MRFGHIGRRIFFERQCCSRSALRQLCLSLPQPFPNILPAGKLRVKAAGNLQQGADTAGDTHRAHRWKGHAGNHLQHGGFSGAVFAQNRHGLPLADIKGQVIYGDFFPGICIVKQQRLQALLVVFKQVEGLCHISELYYYLVFFSHIVPLQNIRDGFFRAAVDLDTQKHEKQVNQHKSQQ